MASMLWQAQTVVREHRDEVEAHTEAHTEELADPPVAAIGGAAERLVERAAPLVTAIIDADGFLPTNPMALRPLVSSGRSSGRSEQLPTPVAG